MSLKGVHLFLNAVAGPWTSALHQNMWEKKPCWLSSFRGHACITDHRLWTPKMERAGLNICNVFWCCHICAEATTTVQCRASVALSCFWVQEQILQGEHKIKKQIDFFEIWLLIHCLNVFLFINTYSYVSSLSHYFSAKQGSHGY